MDYGIRRLHPATDPAILADIQRLLGGDLLDRPRHGRIGLLGRWIHFPLKPADLMLRMPPGFALGAKVARPDHDVVILYGDGSAGYSIMEFDTFARHKLPVGAIIGNDACWMQIYRDQKVFLNDDVACMLDYSHYDEIAKTFGGAGSTISKPAQINTGMKALKQSLAKKKPYILNVLIGRSEFRKGSISM